MSMGAWVEDLVCADPVARTPIGASENLCDQAIVRQWRDNLELSYVKLRLSWLNLHYYGMSGNFNQLQNFTWKFQKIPP
jgi:hypothetical protein